MNRLPFFALLLSLTACSSVGTVGALDAGAGDEQTPPTGEVALRAWLTQGSYQAWHCEPARHGARSPSPHGTDRICSNELLSTHGDGPFPLDAANVKELFHDDGSLRGYAAYRHVLPGDGAESWYWYEILDGTLNADGLGDSGRPATSCVGCHRGAGPDVMGHDFVYTQVR